MRKRSAFAVAVLTVFVSISTAVPAAAAQKTRVYKGETSDAKPISFFIRRGADGQRSFKGYEIAMTLTCEDASTEEWSMGSYWGGDVPVLTDGVLLDIDEAFGSEALHIHGRIGQHRGSGTFRFTIATLTSDEQAQTCSTGDLTWQVEYDHTASGPMWRSTSPSLDRVMEVRIGPDGEVTTRATSPA